MYLYTNKYRRIDTYYTFTIMHISSLKTHVALSSSIFVYYWENAENNRELTSELLHVRMQGIQRNAIRAGKQRESGRNPGPTLPRLPLTQTRHWPRPIQRQDGPDVRGAYGRSRQVQAAASFCIQSLIYRPWAQ